MQITLDIPDEMARNLESRKEDLPQILALGLREISANPATGFSGLTEVLEFLAKLPSPQEILTLRLSPIVQAEIESLLDKNRSQGLDESDSEALLQADRCLWQYYEFIEHLVRLAKSQALLRLQQSA
ncbi:hypothetical protein BMF77_01981 [Dolichospermum sp. UHCC 0315A]|jgi:hypothetical protein|uniref:hypothetical protein n=1 Tax=Dolichospermum TaxID=748770 RepID=UPI0011E8020D|nr:MULTISPECIES: hypothetical protein [Dolichospermum]MDB9435648.1 hypothetical protein [Dolichospermum lemmermannii CS-548]QEI41396.1 hypothetical protein BMF77_01981 [Dolichospermum sp. UHCC 0315A]